MVSTRFLAAVSDVNISSRLMSKFSLFNLSCRSRNGSFVVLVTNFTCIPAFRSLELQNSKVLIIVRLKFSSQHYFREYSLKR